MAAMSKVQYGQCTVCGRELSKQREFGNRHYCDVHLSMLAEDYPPLWRASMLTFAGLMLLAVVLAISNQVLSRGGQAVVNALPAAVVTGLPALLWLLFLYRGAARNGAPLSPLLPTVIVLAALMAAAIVRPFLYELVDIDSWFARTNAANRLLGNMLLPGMINAFVLYGLVRYTVWRTPAFARRVDGVLYTMAAAWGYGSMLLALSIIDLSEITLLNGSLRIVAQLCAYLAPSIIVGYFLGRNRFEDMEFSYLASGIGIAALLHGLLLYTSTELNNVSLSLSRDGFSPWPGLAISIVVVIAVYSAIYGLLMRHNALTRARMETKS